MVKIVEVEEEARRIVSAIHENIPKFLDGRTIVTELRVEGEADGVNYGWKQMEWPGFYFEYFMKTASIRETADIKPGPLIRGSTKDVQFDIQGKFVWDLKVHSNDAVGDVILNDAKAIDACFDQRGGVGFIILCGDADWDESGSFANWHRQQKRKSQGGKDSTYVRSGKDRSSRMRKQAFTPTHIKVIFFHATRPSEEARKATGLLKVFNQGKNPGERSRNPKYMLRCRQVEERGAWLLSDEIAWSGEDFSAPEQVDAMELETT